MRALLLALAVCLVAAPVFGQTIYEAHQVAVEGVLTPAVTFHWANDSWIGQDKLWDHASFAFVLAQLSEDQFRPDNAAKRGLVFTVNMVPWILKEVVDGYGEEGASYKDFLWSALGAGLALFIH